MGRFQSEHVPERNLREHGIRFLEMGVCYSGTGGEDNGRFSTCALEPTDCLPEETFDGHDQDTSAIRKCDPNDIATGRCLFENTCALRATDCAVDTNPSNFNANDDKCTYQRDHGLDWSVNNPAFTQFGSCRDTVSGEHFCAYSPSDCEESETDVYITPVETLSAGKVCDCSEVHVYTCLTDSERMFCSVNANGCDPGLNIFSPFEQRMRRKAGIDKMDCRLCKKKNTVPPTPSPTRPPTPTESPSTSPTGSPIKYTSSNANSGNNTDLMLIGICSAGGVALLVLLFYSFWKTSRLTKLLNQPTFKAHPKAPKILNLGEMEGSVIGSENNDDDSLDNGT